MPHPPSRFLSASAIPSDQAADNDDMNRPNASALRASAQRLADRQHPLEISEYRNSVNNFVESIVSDHVGSSPSHAEYDVQNEEIDIQDADESFDIVFSLLIDHANNKLAMDALSQYSIKSRSVLVDKVSSNITSITERLEEAKTTRDAIEADDNAAEDMLTAQYSIINEYIRKRSHLKMRHQSLMDDRK